MQNIQTLAQITIWLKVFEILGHLPYVNTEKREQSKNY